MGELSFIVWWTEHYFRTKQTPKQDQAAQWTEEQKQSLWVLYLSSQSLSLIPVLQKVSRELEQEQRFCNPGTDCTHSSTLQMEWDAPK